jgi:hypothetical protein
MQSKRPKWTQHPAIAEVELSQDSDYRYEIWLKEEWQFTCGRAAGCRTLMCHNKSEFDYANPQPMIAK